MTFRTADGETHALRGRTELEHHSMEEVAWQAIRVEAVMNSYHHAA